VRLQAFPPVVVVYCMLCGVGVISSGLRRFLASFVCRLRARRVVRSFARIRDADDVRGSALIISDLLRFLRGGFGVIGRFRGSEGVLPRQRVLLLHTVGRRADRRLAPIARAARGALFSRARVVRFVSCARGVFQRAGGVFARRARGKLILWATEICLLRATRGFFARFFLTAVSLRSIRNADVSISHRHSLCPRFVSRWPRLAPKTLKLPSAKLLLKSHGSRDVWWLPIAPVRAVLTFEVESVPL
jgi:hypothetical protein